MTTTDRITVSLGQTPDYGSGPTAHVLYDVSGLELCLARFSRDQVAAIRDALDAYLSDQDGDDDADAAYEVWLHDGHADEKVCFGVYDDRDDAYRFARMMADQPEGIVPVWVRHDGAWTTVTV
jgi:hypothetical protein